jgi:hypothetical protein
MSTALFAGGIKAWHRLWRGFVDSRRQHWTMNGSGGSNVRK